MEQLPFIHFSTLVAVVTIVIVHFIFDFVAQNQWIVLNKDRNFRGLAAHCGVYAIGLSMLFIANPGILVGISAVGWVVSNAIMHGVTDYVTSKFIRNNTVHGAFNVPRMFMIVGADQCVHYFTLFTTLFLFNR
jgi:hypothetical protein